VITSIAGARPAARRNGPKILLRTDVDPNYLFKENVVKQAVWHLPRGNDDGPRGRGKSCARIWAMWRDDDTMFDCCDDLSRPFTARLISSRQQLSGKSRAEFWGELCLMNQDQSCKQDQHNMVTAKIQRPRLWS